MLINHPRVDLGLMRRAEADIIKDCEQGSLGGQCKDDLKAENFTLAGHKNRLCLSDKNIKKNESEIHKKQKI